MFDKCMVDRLRERSSLAWMRVTRRRGLEVGQAATGATRVVEPDRDGETQEPSGEDGSGEGRRVRFPTLPYMPIEKERRDHSVTHYPHRTWCECCMAGPEYLNSRTTAKISPIAMCVVLSSNILKADAGTSATTPRRSSPWKKSLQVALCVHRLLANLTFGG